VILVFLYTPFEVVICFILLDIAFFLGRDARVAWVEDGE
jgi:hypothetical protein